MTRTREREHGGRTLQAVPEAGFTVDGLGERIPLLSVQQIEALDPAAREAYLNKLHNADLDRGTAYYQVWARHAVRCAHVDPATRERCQRERWDGPGALHCLKHADLGEVDPAAAVERRRENSRMRAAALTEQALDQLEELLMLPPEALSPGTRLKVIETVLDRGGVSRRTESAVDVQAEVTVHQGTDIILERLAKMGVEMAAAGITAGPAPSRELPPAQQDVIIVAPGAQDEPR
jgi:hypothetical protein